MGAGPALSAALPIFTALLGGCVYEGWLGRTAACSDQRDNDHDGLVDFPHDPGCALPDDVEESDDCPDGPLCPMCANLLDDDLSGAADFPDDPGCRSAGDELELLEDPGACGGTLLVELLPITGVATGGLSLASVANLPTPCGGDGVPAAAYVMVLGQPGFMRISTSGSTVDTVLDLRTRPCQGASLECSDDLSTSDTSSMITRELVAGVYYILVEAKDPTWSGNYMLTVERLGEAGEPCDPEPACRPGYVCRIPAGGTIPSCSLPVCRDGVDDDADGKIDHPVDPGCADPDDSTEDDACPGPGCPACTDGIDNDMDGQTDWPNDTGCNAAGGASEACTGMACPACADGIDNDMDGEIDWPNDTDCTTADGQSEVCSTNEPIGIIMGAITTGTTAGQHNDYQPICGFSSHTAVDVLWQLDVPDMQSLSLNLVGFDGAHSLLDSECSAPPIACSDPAQMNVYGLQAGRYHVVVDGWSSGSGAYTLTMSGVIVPGGSCEGPLYMSGAFICATGTCSGPPGAKTCQ